MASFLDRILSRGPKIKVLTQQQAARSVVVSNIAPQTTAENIVIHFQKQKYGGGDIDHIHIPREGKAVITFDSSEVVETVLEHSHKLDGSTLKLQQLSPKESPEVFQQVEARFNFDKLHLSPEESKNMLEVIKENTGVAYRKDSKDYIVSGTFSEIEAAHNLLQFLMNQKIKGGEKEVINNAKNTVQNQKNCDNGLDQLTSDTSNIPESNTFEVQPQFMKLLKRVHKRDLQEIEKRFDVEIIWYENTSQVCVSPRKNKQGRFQEGCDAFIDLYQKFHPNMGREEVELPNGADDALIIQAVSLAEAEEPVIIEKADTNLVIYAEKNSIRRSVQSLKEKLGLTNDESNRKNKRGEGDKRRDAREKNETSQKRLTNVLENGVKLSLYQGDITDEPVDAIVNAANERLQHGGGVAAAIVRKGGRQIQEESNKLIKYYGPLDVGTAAYTSGGYLTCRYVIHTVGPEWTRHGKDRSKFLLRRACIESLRLAAVKLQLSSIALTAISSGIFGMPKDICARIMFSAIEEFGSSNEAEFSTLRDVRIVIIDEPTMSVFQEEFVKRYLSQGSSPETVTTQGRPSDDHVATPPTPNTKLEVGTSKHNDSFAPMNQTQNGDNKPAGVQPEKDRNVKSPSIAVAPSEKNCDQRAMPDDIKQASADKANLPTGVGSPKIEGNEVSHGPKHNDSAPLVNPVNGNESTTSKGFSAIGRGRGILAPTFHNLPGKERTTTPNGSKNFEENTTSTTSPPGLAVTEEGKKLARFPEECVTGDQKNDGAAQSVKDKVGVEESKSSNEVLEEGDQIQDFDRDNQGFDGENPNRDSSEGSPTDGKAPSGQSPEPASGDKLKPGETTPDQDKTTQKSEKSASDVYRKRPSVGNTENAKRSRDQLKEDNTKTGKKVQQEPVPVADPTNDETRKTTERETQTGVESSAEDLSTTSFPDPSSDPLVSRQSVNEVDKDKMEKRRHSEDCSRQDPDAGPPPLCKLQTSQQSSEPKCLTCRVLIKDPLYPPQCERGHYFCRSCMQSFDQPKICLQCQKGDRPRGNQPVGTMTWITVTKSSLPGYEDCGIIVMYFKFESGIQGPEHPNPGQPYNGFYTDAFLPYNAYGQEICTLLQEAFDTGLMFTIGTSPGVENNIVWNIELKTSRSGGSANCGYPDPRYLDRVKKQLFEKGITPLRG